MEKMVCRLSGNNEDLPSFELAPKFELLPSLEGKEVKKREIQKQRGDKSMLNEI